MTFRSHLRAEPSLLNFLKYRRIIKHAFAFRLRYEAERNHYRRIANKLTAEDNPFHKHRIAKFEQMQAECLQDIREHEATIARLISPAYECMSTLTGLLTPQERAWLVGATSEWLSQRNASWASMGLFQLYFNLQCEAEKSPDPSTRAMFWFCGLMVSLDTTIHDQYMQSEIEEAESIPARLHLSLVR